MSEANAGTGRAGGARRIELVLERSGLPAELRGVVERVARGTRLWKSERAEVARELVAHFRDGLEGGASADRLLADFGDESVAARLMRRSKKRSRPWAWRAWVRAWQGAGVLAGVGVLAYGVMAIRYFSIQPSVKRNYTREWNAEVEAIPAEQRAWDEYRAATMDRPRDPALFEWEGWPTGEYDEARWREVRAYVSEIQPLLERVRRAAERPSFGDRATTREDAPFAAAVARQKGHERKVEEGSEPGEQNPMLMGVLLPGLGTCRAWARDLSADARVALADGEGERALRDLLAMVGMSRQLLRHRTLIGQLVGQAIGALAGQEAGRALAEHPGAWSDGQLRDLAHALGALSEERFPNMRGERDFFDDVVQRVYSDDGTGGGRIAPGGIEALRAMAWSIEPVEFGISQVRQDNALVHAAGPLLSEFTAGRREAVALYNRLMAETERLGALPAWERIDDPGVALLEREAARLRDRLDTKVVSLVFPSMISAYWSADVARTQREGVLVGIALELYRRREGRWPESLEELVPGLLPALPRDIYDGAALRYVVREGKPMVYSVGPDRDDDGGRDQAGKHAWAWPGGSTEVGDADSRIWPRDRE